MTKKKRPGVKPAIPSPEEGQPVTAIETPLEAGADSSVRAEASFPIVGIGASAGELAAFEAFFGTMPADTKSGTAFVLVQHLAPNHKSILSDLVKKYTRMRVYEAEDGMAVRPNCTYISSRPTATWPFCTAGCT